MERINLSNAYKPGYWNEHSLKDRCEWVPASYFEPFFLFDKGAEEFARHRFTEFFNHPLRFPVRRLADGQTFDTSKFPLGTVVRFEEELLLKSSGPLEIVYPNGEVVEQPYPGSIGAESHTHWGVVAMHNHLGNPQPGLIHVVYQPYDEAGPAQAGGPNIHYLKYSPVNVGEIKHCRQYSQSPSTKMVWHETLERVKWLEVMEASDEGTYSRNPLKSVLGKILPRLSKPAYAR